MAIQFACPHCQAPIRVNDAAGGKRGKCPNCKNAVLVPVVTAPDSGGTAAASDQTAGAAPATPPAPGVEVSAPPVIGVPAVGVQEPAVRRAPPRKRGLMSIVAPVLLFGLMIGGVFLMLRTPETKLAGTLSAEVVSDFVPVAKVIPLAELNLPADRAAEVQRQMEVDPLPEVVLPGSLKLTIDAAPRGVSVLFKPLPGVRVFRVNPSADPLLQQALQKRLSAWRDVRSNVWLAGAEKFGLAVETAQQSGTSFRTSQWLDTFALPAVEEGFGFVVEAVANKKVYRCVHEDDRGRLYFFLPEDTKEFQLRGRDLGETQVPTFAGKYTVTVTPSKSTPANPAPVIDENLDSTPDPATDPAMDAMKSPDSTE